MPDSQDFQALRAAIDVQAGLLPGSPEPEFDRRFVLLSEQWYAEGANQNDLLLDLAGRANAYATYLMIHPDRLNWVNVVWVWF